jgi:hypothetical protein
MIKLSNAEVQVEDLKEQLDDALGAEEMLVQLTERNLMLSEVRDCIRTQCSASDRSQKIEEMRINIEDLESLKELNDELEENHVETEKHMQEDLGASSLISQKTSTYIRFKTERIRKSVTTFAKKKSWKTNAFSWRAQSPSSGTSYHSFKGKYSGCDHMRGIKICGQ